MHFLLCFSMLTSGNEMKQRAIVRTAAQGVPCHA